MFINEKIILSRMRTGYKVGDAMTKKPVIVSKDTTLKDCAIKMKESHVGALVVEENKKAIGIITEQDIVRKVVAEGKDASSTKVSDAMEKGLTTIAPGADLYEALVIMKNKNIRHLPVVFEDEMLGLLTIKDVLKIQPQLFDLIVEKFEIREAERKPIHIVKEGEGLCHLCGNYSDELKPQNGVMVCEDCFEERI